MANSDLRTGINRGLIAVLTPVLLSACQGPRVTGACPAYVHYNQAEDHALLAELQAHPDLVETRHYLRDYGKMRKSVSVLCTGE